MASSRTYHFAVGQMVIITIGITGPAGTQAIPAILDTGAARSLIHPDVLRTVGYELDHPQSHQNIATASRVERVPLVRLTMISALGRTRHQFSVAAHPLPSAARIQALLGLDFFRGEQLHIDFISGSVRLS